MRIFVSRRIPEVGLALMRDAGLQLDVWPEELPPDHETLVERVAGCDGILSLLTDPIDAAVMDAAGSNLKVISNFAVGYDNVALEEAKRRGISVGNTPDVLTDATADLALALLLAASRRLGEAQDFVKEGRWETWHPLHHIGLGLTGKTLGVYGMGRIGAAVAQRCAGGWGMKVVYCARTAKPARAPGHAQQVDFRTLLEVSDFISVHAPLTPETKGLFDAQAFSHMKSSAVFVNTARGGIHDQGALYEALRSQQIFAAGLDVTDPEPMGADDPLLTLGNCFVVPHIGSGTIASREAMATIAARNVIHGVRGEPLQCAVQLGS